MCSFLSWLTLLGAQQDRRLWLNALFVLSTQAGGFYSVNPTTGASTFIAATQRVVRGLSFSPARQLFAFDSFGGLYTINPLTGSAVFVGSSGPPISLMAEDSTFASDGQLYLADFGGDIFRVDTADGSRVLVGQSEHESILGLVASPTVSPLPEPSALLLVTIGALGVIGRVWRRRNVAASL